MKNAIARQVTNEILNCGFNDPGSERTLNDVALMALSVSVGRGCLIGPLLKCRVSRSVQV